MEHDGLKRRNSQPPLAGQTVIRASSVVDAEELYPAGKVKHGGVVQLLRMLLFATWFSACLLSIHTAQLAGAPLYFFNKDYYYAYMALSKQSFGIFITTITQWFSPTLVRVSGDASVQGQLHTTEDGTLKTAFPERLVLLANHQVYTDWLYLWWIAYTNRMHGHIFIILKESLKYIPLIGPGMMFYGFVFMARKWVSDKPRLQHRLQKLKERHSGPLSGSAGLDPMWLLLFPEGTNLSRNTRGASKKWSENQGISDMQHLLLPRSTGLFFCLQQLKGTVGWLYDCTVAYEGTRPGGYASDIFTLRSTYFQGRPPKSVNMYWRRFPITDIPLENPQDFEVWVSDRWKEKDQFLEQFYLTGRFAPFPASLHRPGDDGDGDTGYVSTEVRLEKWYEVGQIFVIGATLALLSNVVTKMLRLTLLSSRRYANIAVYHES